MRKPQALIVGAGRAGLSLALALKAAGYPTAVVARSVLGRRRIQRLRLKPATKHHLRSAHWVFVAVPDRFVEAQARALESQLGANAALVHLAGSLSLKALPAERARGSFHPLCAMASTQTSLRGCHVAVAASNTQLERQLRSAAKDIGCHPLRVPEANREEYHAAAVMSAGLAVTLVELAVQSAMHAGLRRRDAERALVHLSQSALLAALEHGTQRSLTGPAVRGDLRTIKAHQSALTGHSRRAYAVLTAAMQSLLRPR